MLKKIHIMEFVVAEQKTTNPHTPKQPKKQAQQERKHKCINFFEVLFGIMFIYLFINKYDVNLKL